MEKEAREAEERQKAVQALAEQKSAAKLAIDEAVNKIAQQIADETGTD